MPTQEQIEKVIKLIHNRYDSDFCGYTEYRSEGNSNDVFSDGTQCGESQVLYEIGVILGLELPEPKEQEW